MENKDPFAPVTRSLSGTCEEGVAADVEKVESSSPRDERVVGGDAQSTWIAPNNREKAGPDASRYYKSFERKQTPAGFCLTNPVRARELRRARLKYAARETTGPLEPSLQGTSEEKPSRDSLNESSRGTSPATTATQDAALTSTENNNVIKSETRSKKRKATGRTYCSTTLQPRRNRASKESPDRDVGDADFTLASPTHLSRDERPIAKPGAVRVQGLQCDEADDEADEEAPAPHDNDEQVPELSAELVAGVPQDRQELLQLRERLANAVEAQEVVEEGNKHGDSELSGDRNANSSADKLTCSNREGKKVVVLWALCLLLAASTVTLGTMLILRGRNNDRSATATDLSPITTNTNSPSNFPTSMGPSTSTLIPTMMPTPLTAGLLHESSLKTCSLALTMECNVFVLNLEDDSVEKLPCSGPIGSITSKRCNYTPFRAGFLYNGGSCERKKGPRGSSDFSCSDKVAGPPPTEYGAQSYIIVTDDPRQGYRGHIYFSGFVNVGEFYHIGRSEDEVHENGDRLLENGIRISIFRSNDIGDPENNLLQEVVYQESLCSGLEELGIHFGASQLSSFQNENQGYIASSVSTAVEPSVSIDIRQPDWGSGTLAISSLTASSNLFRFANFSDEMQGSLLEPGGVISVSVPVDVHVEYLRHEGYFLHSAAIATDTNVPDTVCAGVFGQEVDPVPVELNRPPPPPPPPPPIADSRPYLDPSETACETESMITCEYGIPDGRRTLGECENMIDPRTISCTNDLPATGLAFRYLGGGLPRTVFIEASANDDVAGSDILFSAAVTNGDIFRFDGNFRGEVAITISFLGLGDKPGDEIDKFVVNTACERDSNSTPMTLTSTYGPLELVGFENLFGYFSSILEVHVQYFVLNSGYFPMVLESALVTSEFLPETIETLTDEEWIVDDYSPPWLIYEEFGTLDFGETSAPGDIVAFALNITGRGENSSLPCSDTSEYTFSF